MRRFGFENDYGKSMDYGIRFLEFPSIVYGEEIVENKSVAGRTGTLTVRTGRYDDTIITNVFEFSCKSLREYDVKVREVKRWLNKTVKLKYTDSEEMFYIVKDVKIDSIERRYNFFCEMKVVFTCEPPVYYDSGAKEYSIDELTSNMGSWSQPIYKITGDGECTITVNGKSMTANVSGDIIIDTVLMIAYRDDGTSQNTAVSGSYEDLYLQEGSNVITVTEGFKCKVIPNWRCLQ